MSNWKKYMVENWKNYVAGRPEGHPIVEKDLRKLGIWSRAEELKKELFLNTERKNCVLIQGGAFVVNGWAYLILGMSSVDILEAIPQHKEIEGIIGTGNSLYISKDFKYIYSSLSESESQKRYETEKTNHKIKYMLKGRLAPLIILNRSFRDPYEYKRTKESKQNKIVLDLGTNFYTKPIKYAGSIKARLRSKFVKTARTVHCVTNPTLTEKELLFDKESEVKELIDNFKNYFMLGYILWSQKFANSVGITSNYSLDLKDNPSEIIGFGLLRFVQQFYRQNRELYFKNP